MKIRLIPKAELVGLSLGCLQGIDFGAFFFNGLFYVRGHIAFSETPLGGGIREDKAKTTGRKNLGFLTSFTLLNDFVTGASIELAPLIAHEMAIQSFFYGCTNHGYHVLSLRI
jgi:hypothetical protein